MNDFPFRWTRHGFQWGPLRVQRSCSGLKLGVVLDIGSEYEQWEVRISPKGRNVQVCKRETVYWAPDEAQERGEGDE